ncbi:MAG: type II secretion system protein M [Comamonadaceae bacterium]|nr:MAG: type II secretion system protein M [Comamonadaceae bacterium]
MKRQPAVQQRWRALAPRERAMVLFAGGLVALALLWWVALAPALRTLAAAPAEHRQLDLQLQQMTTLQQQARALQAQPRASRDEALRALDASVRGSLGTNAQLASASGNDGANIALRGVPAESLAAWLVQARGDARAVPREVHLARSAASTVAVPAASPLAGSSQSTARWDGTLVMSLPADR